MRGHLSSNAAFRVQSSSSRKPCGPALSDYFVHALWPVTYDTFHSNGVKVSSAQLLSLLVFQFISKNIIMLLNIWGEGQSVNRIFIYQ